VNDVFECGLSAGLTVISWQEINSWQQATQKKGIWLAKTIKHLSESYIDEYRLANNVTKQSPLHADSEEQRQAVAKQFNQLFRK
jgi:hypothetical protein